MTLMTNHVSSLDYFTTPFYGSVSWIIKNGIYNDKGFLLEGKQPLPSHFITRFYLQNQLELSLGLKSSISYLEVQTARKLLNPT